MHAYNHTHTYTYDLIKDAHIIIHFLFHTQVPYGIGMAAGIRVGNMLGAGEPGKAKKSAVVAFCFACKS